MTNVKQLKRKNEKNERPQLYLQNSERKTNM